VADSPPPEIGDIGDAGNIEAVSEIFSKKTKSCLFTPGASWKHTGAGPYLYFQKPAKLKNSRSHLIRDQARQVACRLRP
jgi:hypothetical protein